MVSAQSSILYYLSSNPEIPCCYQYSFDKRYANSVIPGAINEKLASCTTCTISLEPGSHEVVNLHDSRRLCLHYRIAPLLA